MTGKVMEKSQKFIGQKVWEPCAKCITLGFFGFVLNVKADLWRLFFFLSCPFNSFSRLSPSLSFSPCSLLVAAVLIAHVFAFAALGYWSLAEALHTHTHTYCLCLRWLALRWYERKSCGLMSLSWQCVWLWVSLCLIPPFCSTININHCSSIQSVRQRLETSCVCVCVCAHVGFWLLYLLTATQNTHWY